MVIFTMLYTAPWIQTIKKPRSLMSQNYGRSLESRKKTQPSEKARRSGRWGMCSAIIRENRNQKFSSKGQDLRWSKRSPWIWNSNQVLFQRLLNMNCQLVTWKLIFIIFFVMIIHKDNVGLSTMYNKKHDLYALYLTEVHSSFCNHTAAL